MKRWDDLDDALVGFTQIYLEGERAHTLVYSGNKIIDLLKNRDKLYNQDKIWERICTDLRWQFIRSI